MDRTFSSETQYAMEIPKLLDHIASNPTSCSTLTLAASCAPAHLILPGRRNSCRNLLTEHPICLCLMLSQISRADTSADSKKHAVAIPCSSGGGEWTKNGRRVRETSGFSTLERKGYSAR